MKKYDIRISSQLRQINKRPCFLSIFYKSQQYMCGKN